jgi:hypothetical protein
MKTISDLIEKYGKHYSIAFIYTIFAFISLISAAILFGLLDGTGIMKIAIPKYVDEAEFGGAISGFLLTLIFLIRSYNSVFTDKILVIKGNVLFSDKTPIDGALVFIDGIDKQKKTDSTGWFSIEVDDKLSEWIVRAYYNGKNAECKVTLDTIKNPVKLLLDNDAGSSSVEKKKK